MNHALTVLEDDNGPYDVDSDDKALHEKVNAINDYICNNADYDYDSEWKYHQTAYTALVDGWTVCAGYARSFKLFCDYYDIPCVVVNGYSYNVADSQAHAWNYVQMDDDNWYAVDLTWNDLDGGPDDQSSDEYLLVGSETEIGWRQDAFGVSHLPKDRFLTQPELSADRYALDRCGDNLTWSYNAGVLTISGTGAMYNMTADICPWSQHSSDITSVVIESGVTTIGDYAFMYCTSLASVVIPDGVTAIGYYAFFGCSSLLSVSIPKSVTTIGESAFEGCESLTSVVIPSSVTVIDYWTFYGCSSLATVTFTGNAPAIYNYAFGEVTATVYYPAGNATWTDEVKQQYGGTLTWVAKEMAPAIPDGLHQDSDGIWRYYLDGEVATDFTDLVAHTDGNIYYVENGVLAGNYIGLYAHTNGNVYYVCNGMVASNYVGLYSHSDGKTYYVYNGIVPTSYVGLCYHTDGKAYYVYNGVLVPSYVGFYLHSDGKLYYISSGAIAAGYTGLAQHTNGLLYYVKSGVFDAAYNGTAKTADGTEYTVVNGVAQP